MPDRMIASRSLFLRFLRVVHGLVLGVCPPLSWSLQLCDMLRTSAAGTLPGRQGKTRARVWPQTQADLYPCKPCACPAYPDPHLGPWAVPLTPLTPLTPCRAVRRLAGWPVRLLLTRPGILLSDSCSDVRFVPVICRL